MSDVEQIVSEVDALRQRWQDSEGQARLAALHQAALNLSKTPSEEGCAALLLALHALNPMQLGDDGLWLLRRLSLFVQQLSELRPAQAEALLDRIITYQEPLSTPAARRDYAESLTNRAVVRQRGYHYLQALEDIRASLQVRQGLQPSLRRQRRAYWNDLGLAWTVHADVLRNLSRLEEALTSLDQAVKLRRQAIGLPPPAAPGNPVFTKGLAESLSKRALLQRIRGDFTAALADSEEALQLRRQLRQQAQPEEEATRIDDLAIGYSQQGMILRAKMHLERALDAFGEAISLRQGLFQGTPGTAYPARLAQELATNHSQRATTLKQMRRYQAALDDLDTAIRLRSEQPQAAAFANDLAHAYSQRGQLHALLGAAKAKQARADYTTALELRHTTLRPIPDPARTAPTAYNDLATTYLLLAILEREEGKLSAAADALQKAWDIRSALGAACDVAGQAWPLWLRSDLAAVCFQRATLYYQEGQIADALTESERGSELLHTIPPGLYPRLDAMRAAAYAEGVRGLSQRAEPVEWARAKGVELAEMLDAPSPPLAERDTLNELRDYFQRFHAGWFGWAVATQRFDLLPEILSRIQGRDLAAAVRDEIARYRQQMPAAAREYHQIREELRAKAGEMAAQLALREGAEGAFLDTPSVSKEYQRLLDAHGKLTEALHRVRAELARLPDFSPLEPSGRGLSLAALQQRLEEQEALLLLIDTLAGEEGFLLIPPQQSQQPLRWYPSPELLQLYTRLHHFGGQLNRRQNYRRAPFDDTAPPPDVPLEDYWEGFARDLSAALWEPLRPALERLQRLKRLVCVTHGRLHSLPLSPGAPDDHLEYAHYPGLIFFAMQRGIHPAPALPPSLTPIPYGLLTDPGARHDIPLTGAEGSALTEIWGERPHNPFSAQRTTPCRVDFLHIACHGSSARERQPVTLLIGNGQRLDMHALIERPIYYHRVYINACVGGRTVEDLDGNPAGLFTGFFRRSAQVVIAALLPIPDRWSLPLALLTHYAIQRDHLDTHCALRRAKQQIGSGKWPEEVARLVREWSCKTLQAEILGYLREKINNYGMRRFFHKAWRGDAPNGTGSLAAQLTSAGLDPAAVEELATRLDNQPPENIAQAVAAALVAHYFAPPCIPSQPELGILLHAMVAFGMEDGGQRRGTGG